MSAVKRLATGIELAHRPREWTRPGWMHRITCRCGFDTDWIHDLTTARQAHDSHVDDMLDQETSR